MERDPSTPFGRRRDLTPLRMTPDNDCASSLRNKSFRCHPQRERAEVARSSRRTRIPATLLVLALLLVPGCAHKPDPNTLVMLIESSPTNLDPRVGVDAQSERIDELLFDSLVRRDEHFNLYPWLAESWEIPDPLTYIFHLHHGVRFHNGQPLTARDVKWTIDSLISGKLRSAKASTYAPVDHIEAPDEHTVIFHLKAPFAPLLWNLSDGAIGIVPYGSGEDFNRNPIGSGPFRFVSAQQDKEVVIERNPGLLGEPTKLERVRFKVIPDATTRALELRKRSADVAINSLTADTVVTLQARSRSHRYAIAGNHLRLPGDEFARPDLEGHSRAACDCLCDQHSANHSLPAARRGAPGLQRSAAAALGL